MDDMALLRLCFDLADAAGRAILEVRARGFDTRHKADRSPVTEADHAAEAVIVAGLRAATPGVPVVAEEEIAAGHVPNEADMARAGAFWLVDPLDGTREFAAGRDDFAVCIGLVRGGRPALGVVSGPAHGTAHGGVVGQGAWARDANGTLVPIRVRRAPPELIVIASRHARDDARVADLLAGRAVAAMTNIGSALKFTAVADGRADVYPRFGRTMEWDTAAGQALVEAAGGSVRVIGSDAALAYGKPGWANPGFVAAGLP